MPAENADTVNIGRVATIAATGMTVGTLGVIGGAVEEVKQAGLMHKGFDIVDRIVGWLTDVEA